MFKHERKPEPPRSSAADAPPMRLHAMREADLDALMEIEHACFSSHWSRDALTNELGNACAFYVVGTSGAKTVGYGGEWIIMDEAHITNIAVDPARHGQRFGERILMALLREARYRGARRATLEVRVGNAPALGLYRKYGFETVAIRRKYYQDNDEDALVMWVNDLFTPRLNDLLNQAFRE